MMTFKRNLGPDPWIFHDFWMIVDPIPHFFFHDCSVESIDFWMVVSRIHRSLVIRFISEVLLLLQEVGRARVESTLATCLHVVVSPCLRCELGNPNPAEFPMSAWQVEF